MHGGDLPAPAGVADRPVTSAGLPLLEARSLSKVYPSRGGRPAPAAALEGVDVTVRQGECLGVVGESGAGKTTLAICLAGLMSPSSGSVTYRGAQLWDGGRPRVPRVHGIQIVFQDPASSLNPRRTVGSVLAEILAVHRLRPRADIPARVRELLGLVGLDAEIARRRPGRLSGGQQQRVAIARALAFEPELVIADEIVSALDASVQAQILNLLADLRSDLGLSIVLVTHDMSVARHLCDRIIVMRTGRIVETGLAERVLLHPAHPYTQELLRAVPRLHDRPEPGPPPAEPSGAAS